MGSDRGLKWRCSGVHLTDPMLKTAVFIGKIGIFRLVFHRQQPLICTFTTHG